MREDSGLACGAKVSYHSVQRLALRVSRASPASDSRVAQDSLLIVVHMVVIVKYAEIEVPANISKPVAPAKR